MNNETVLQRLDKEYEKERIERQQQIEEFFKGCEYGQWPEEVLALVETRDAECIPELINLVED